jgi:hypothetical protein
MDATTLKTQGNVGIESHPLQKLNKETHFKRRNTMKKLLAALVILLGATSVFAPTNSFAQQSVHTYFADDFANFSVQGQTPNVFLVSASSLCQFTADGKNFFPFNTNAPVLIAESVTANSEIVTPTTAVNRSGQCGITASPANPHYSFQLKSGTAGLQEAINALGSGSAVVQNLYIGPAWYALAGNLPGTNAAAVIAAAKGSTKVRIIDLTASTLTQYTWNGTAYVSSAY